MLSLKLISLVSVIGSRTPRLQYLQKQLLQFFVTGQVNQSCNPEYVQKQHAAYVNFTDEILIPQHFLQLNVELDTRSLWVSDISGLR